MIDIKYIEKSIRVETEDISKLYKLPITFCVESEVSKKIIWSTKMEDGWWATFPNNEINNTLIYDGDQKLISTKKWNVYDHGSYLYKALYFYCQKLKNQNKKPIGVAVGTHDGEFGEWVPLIIDKISDAVLIEASEKQFNKLKENYEKYSNVELLNCVVSTDGKQVEFFEGGLGYTNSIVERVIRNWETETIGSTIKNTTNINEILVRKYDWLHTDVEGYDAKLIMGIDIDLLPDFIIFEHENLESDEKKELDIYLRRLGYELNYKDVSCLAIR